MKDRTHNTIIICILAIACIANTARLDIYIKRHSKEHLKQLNNCIDTCGCCKKIIKEPSDLSLNPIPTGQGYGSVHDFILFPWIPSIFYQPTLYEIIEKGMHQTILPIFDGIVNIINNDSFSESPELPKDYEPPIMRLNNSFFN